MDNIEDLNNLIKQSRDISGIDIKQTLSSYIVEVLSIYPLDAVEMANLKICYSEGKSINECITRLSNIKLRYESVINRL